MNPKMTREELVASWKERLSDPGGMLKIRHKNMKTVEFMPTSYEESVFHKFTGYWICLQTNDLMISETIKIKLEDLVNWEIIEE